MSRGFMSVGSSSGVGVEAGVEAGDEFGSGSVTSVDTYVSSEWLYDSVVPL